MKYILSLAAAALLSTQIILTNEIITKRDAIVSSLDELKDLLKEEQTKAEDLTNEYRQMPGYNLNLVVGSGEVLRQIESKIKKIQILRDELETL